MSSLSYIDPSFDASKLRAEFKVPISPSGVYKNDFRILNVGVEKTNNGDSTYNVLCGAYGIIRDIAVYNGSQLLDQVQQFNIYTGIKSLLHDNSENISVHRKLTRNKLGYVAKGNNNVTDGAYDFGQLNDNGVPNEGDEVFGNDADAKKKPRNGSWLDLSECLGFFRESMYIPMNVYSDLRVVVTYVNSTQLKFSVKDQTADLATLRPLLVCEYEPDMELAEQMMNQYEGVAFDSVEHDSIRIPASAAGADALVEQDVGALAKGFNNKYISKVIMVNTPTVATTWINGNDATSFANNGSVAQLDWAYQARVNGQNIFPNAYKRGKMRTLGLLCDIWGEQNIAFGQNWTGVSGGGDKVLAANITDTVGQAAYSAFSIDDVVQELKLSLQRTAVGKGAAGNATDNENLRQALNLNIFGISRKQILPSDTGIVIRYV